MSCLTVGSRVWTSAARHTGAARGQGAHLHACPCRFAHCPSEKSGHTSRPPALAACRRPRRQGYRFYLIFFYVLVATLFAATGICIWVGWCFKNDSFPFLWPIKVARIVVSVFVSMFYIASLNIFLIAMQCQPHTNAAGARHWVHLIYHLGGCRARGVRDLCEA